MSTYHANVKADLEREAVNLETQDVPGILVFTHKLCNIHAEAIISAISNFLIKLGNDGS